jgi:pyruvyl transferase EpsI
MICSLKVGVEYFYYKKMIEGLGEREQPFDLLLGTPLHTNLGDHLITVSEMEFLKKLQNSRTVVEIPTEVYQLYKNELKNMIDKSSTIYINGGGWMGNLWPHEELLLQDMVRTFDDHRIIIFPQTIFYDKNIKLYDELLASSAELIKHHKNLYLFVRDRQSYEFALQAFGEKNIYLIPDIALSYQFNCIENKNRVKAVGFCLRHDRECSRDQRVIKDIRIVFKNSGYRQKKIDTMTKFRVPSFHRMKILRERLYDFSKYSFLVTDRLHGMIFAYVTHTPCIILDNKTGKVFGVYEAWLSKLSWIYPVHDSLDQSELKKFISYMEKNRRLDQAYNINFDLLQEIILNG